MRKLLVVCLLLSCSSNAPWWQTDSGCPEGTSLLGTPPASTEVTPPTEQTSTRPSHEVWCASDSDQRVPPRNGPYQSWYENGQIDTTAVYKDGVIVELTRRDLLGREVMKQTSASTHTSRQWWHANGTLAVAGEWSKGQPVGKWSEWDETGALIGEVTYEAGIPGPLTGSSPLVLYAASNWLEDSERTLPTSTSTDLPRPATLLEVTGEKILVNGVPVLSLVDGRIPESVRRGNLITPLYEKLLEEAANAKEIARAMSASPEAQFKGEIIFQCDGTLPHSVLRELIYAAGQAQFGEIMFLTTVGVQWPPRTGLAQLRGRTPTAVVKVALPQLHSAGKVRLNPPQVVVTADALSVTPPYLCIKAGLLSYECSAPPPAPVSIPCSGGCLSRGGIDLVSLQNTLSTLKQNEPASPDVPDGVGRPTKNQSIVVVPHRDTPLQTVIDLMEAVEKKEGASLYPDVMLGWGP